MEHDVCVCEVSHKLSEACDDGCEVGARVCEVSKKVCEVGLLPVNLVNCAFYGV